MCLILFYVSLTDKKLEQQFSSSSMSSFLCLEKEHIFILICHLKSAVFHVSLTEKKLEQQGQTRNTDSICRASHDHHHDDNDLDYDHDDCDNNDDKPGTLIPSVCRTSHDNDHDDCDINGDYDDCDVDDENYDKAGVFKPPAFCASHISANRF